LAPRVGREGARACSSCAKGAGGRPARPPAWRGDAPARAARRPRNRWAGAPPRRASPREEAHPCCTSGAGATGASSSPSGVRRAKAIEPGVEHRHEEERQAGGHAQPTDDGARERQVGLACLHRCPGPSAAEPTRVAMVVIRMGPKPVAARLEPWRRAASGPAAQHVGEVDQQHAVRDHDCRSS